MTVQTMHASTALRRLFDQQFPKAVKLSNDEDGIKALYPLLANIGIIEEGEGKIPFLIVVQTPDITLPRRILQVKFNGKPVVNHLSAERALDFGILPKKHYLAVGLDTDMGVRHSLRMDLGQFRAQKRFGCTTIEGITAVMYEPGILKRCHLYLPGSSYGTEGVPCFYASDEGLRLCARWRNNPEPGFGWLSCRTRLVRTSF